MADDIITYPMIIEILYKKFETESFSVKDMV